MAIKPANILKEAIRARMAKGTASNYKAASKAWKEKDRADLFDSKLDNILSSPAHRIRNEHFTESGFRSIDLAGDASDRASAAWKEAKNSNYAGQKFKNRKGYREDITEEREYQHLKSDGGFVGNQEGHQGTVLPSPLQQQVGAPTANQAAAGASGTPIQDIMQNAQRNAAENNGLSSFNASMKALRKKGGKADSYAANRIEGDHAAVVDMINEGNYGDAAQRLELTGNYTQANRQELLTAAHEHFGGQANAGPGMMDYVNGHKIISTAAGVTIAGGTVSAIMNSGGRKSNAELYSSPF